MKKSFIKPENILGELEIKKGMQIADFGCGAGAWTIPAAFLVGNSGKVYTLDILSHMLEVTGSKVKKFNLKNVQLIKADIELSIELSEGIKIKKESCDLVIMSNILFQLKEKEIVFANAKKILKKDGKILVVDWQSKAKLGPEDKLQIKKEEMQKIVKNQGFELVKELDAGHYHYGLLFKLS